MTIIRKHFREKSALVSSLSLSRVPKEVPAAAGQKVVSLENTISEMCLSFASGNIYDAADGDIPVTRVSNGMVGERRHSRGGGYPCTVCRDQFPRRY